MSTLICLMHPCWRIFKNSCWLQMVVHVDKSPTSTFSLVSLLVMPKIKKQQRAPLKAHFIHINILHVLHGQAHSAQGLGETAVIGCDPSPEKSLSVRLYKENSPLFPSTPHPTASHVSAQLFLLQAGFSWGCRIIPFSASKAVVSHSNIYL